MTDLSSRQRPGQLFDVDLPPIVESDARTYVMAATPWPSNAALILDCARLGYLRSEWVTLDATYGLGSWWGLWHPDELVANDLDPAKGDCHHDFRERCGFEAVRLVFEEVCR